MIRFVVVGGSSTSPTTNTRRKEVLVDAYVDQDGYVQNAGFIHKPIKALERGPIRGPAAIVLHRTVSSTASSTLNAFRRGIGTHFLIDKDGTIYQVASLKQYTAHVGPIRVRCLAEGKCPPADLDRIKRFTPRQGHDHEKAKPYPDRYPMNEDSVGIEVVAMYHEGNATWDAPTPEQETAIRRVIRILKKSYGLEDRDVYAHDLISRKTAGEGQGLYTGDDVPPGVWLLWPKLPPP